MTYEITHTVRLRLDLADGAPITWALQDLEAARAKLQVFEVALRRELEAKYAAHLATRAPDRAGCCGE